MQIEDFDCFYQKGGDYLIPVEILQELLSDIDDLKEKNKKLELELELRKTALKREHEAIHRSNDLEEALEEIKRYINNFDVFKEFSFPLMKKWEEKEVQSSIDYEFKTSIQKNILDITNKVLQIVKEEQCL